MKNFNGKGYITISFCDCSNDDYNKIVSDLKEHFRDENITFNKYDSICFIVKINNIKKYRSEPINLDFTYLGCAVHEHLLTISGNAKHNEVILCCQGCTRLQFFSINNAYIITKPRAFFNCISLEIIGHFNTEKSKFMQYLFAGCTSLRIFPKLNFYSAKNTFCMFKDTILEEKGYSSVSDEKMIDRVQEILNNTNNIKHKLRKFCRNNILIMTASLFVVFAIFLIILIFIPIIK